MPRRGIFGNLSKMSRRQFLCRGQPPERLELNFRCPRIVTVLMRRPPHLAPTLVICFPSEHRSTAHGKTRKSGVRRHHVRACFGASMPEPLLPKPAKMPRMRDPAFISNEMCPHARTRLTFLVLKRTSLTTLFFAFQVITSTCLEICSPLCAPRSHVTCISNGTYRCVSVPFHAWVGGSARCYRRHIFTFATFPHPALVCSFKGFVSTLHCSTRQSRRASRT